MIGTQSVPMLLMSAIEAFCVVNILIFMLLQVVGVQNLHNCFNWTKAHLLDQSRIQRLRADTSEPASATLASSPPQHPIVQLRTIILRIGELQYFTQ
jgi:hypothetical protein